MRKIISAEDASQVAVFAYLLQSRSPDEFYPRVLERISDDYMKTVAAVLYDVAAKKDLSAHEQDAIASAKYYWNWAQHTARTAMQASRRPRIR